MLPTHETGNNMYTDSLSIAAYIGTMIAAILLIRFFSKPLKFMLKLLSNAVLGCACIMLLNSFCGAQIGINPITAAVCAVLGIPGAGALYAASVFLFI